MFRFDIVCLLETFLVTAQGVESLLSNALLYFKPAIKLSTHGRPSGGVVVLVKSELVNIFNISEIINPFDNIICLKLNCTISSAFQDIMLIVSYIPPVGSPYYGYSGYTHGFLIVDEFLSYLYKNYTDFSILLCGDLNARLSNIQPVPDCEYNTRYIDSIDLNIFDNTINDCFDRLSEDADVNGYGRYLYDLCNNYTLYIINGMNKCKSSSSSTFLSSNGSSVIDYFIVSEGLLNFDLNMKVLSDVISWHMPITLSVGFNLSFINSNTTDLNTEISKIIWDTNKSNEYIEELSSLLDDDFVDNIKNVIPVNVNLAVKTLSNVLIDASKCMLRSFKPSKNMLHVKNKWFDRDCSIKRREVKKCLHTYVKNKSNQNRQTYVQTRNEYKSLLSRKKYLFTITKISCTRDCSKSNSRLFWKEIRSVLPKKKNVFNTIQINDWFLYFSQVFNITREPPSICSELRVNYCFDQAELDLLHAPVTETECIDVIKSLNSRKAPGADSILNEMINNCNKNFIWGRNIVSINIMMKNLENNIVSYYSFIIRCKIFRQHGIFKHIN